MLIEDFGLEFLSFPVALGKSVRLICQKSPVQILKFPKKLNFDIFLFYPSTKDFKLS